MIQEPIFTRRYSIRLPQQLVSPRIFSTDFLEFPKNSAFHFTEVDNVTHGPASDEFMFRNITKKIPVRHVTEIAAENGNPRRTSVQLLPLIRSFHLKNRRYRWVRDKDKVPTDENVLFVVNHALSAYAYRYVRSPFSDYNRWLNINSTIFYQIGKAVQDTHRHQYVIFHLPKQLPSVPRLNTFVKRTSQDMLKTFSDPNAAFILELWKWFDPETRHLSTLNYLDPKHYDKTNIIFEDSGRWFFFNLGLINSWIYSSAAALENYEDYTIINDVVDFANLGLEDIGQQKVKIAPEQIRKRFLRCLMALMETRTVESAGDEDNYEDGENIKPAVMVEEQQADEESDSLSETNLKNLDADLEQLEAIEKETEIQESIAETQAREIQANVQSNEPIDIHDFEVSKDHVTVVKDMCDKLATDGLMSGAELRRMMTLTDKSENLDSPVPGVKMRDYIQIKPEDLELKTRLLPDQVTILDKSQLKSSLENFDRTYIEKTLSKETVRMAMGTQKAGFIVSDYKVENYSSILGDQELHTFRVNPVVGKPATINFRVPKIDPSGEFTVGGVQYRMRKMRTDLPIRKIGFDRVQLSSYYGKIFVSRSDKKVNDYGEWLVRSINDKALEENSGITSIKPGDVFHNLDKTPTCFSAVSRQIREITNQGFVLLFDTVDIERHFTKELVAKFRRKNFLIFGDNGKGKYLLIDDNNTLYTTDGVKDPEVFSTFEEFFGLDALNAPVPFAEARVFGLGIPLGLVLGYYYGLEKLMAMLKVVPRRVLVGQRANLQPHEFKIDFQDESLIFNRDDKLATMILGGFTEFAKSTRNYSVYKFDTKGVYLSVLEQKKITVRYIRELDLLDDMFVDPITEDLLKIMKEPLTFRGLIVRSAELLLNDHHPNQLNMDYQTIRGYERIAGAIYSEMVMGVREQRKSLGRANSQITINPHAVWKRIVTDPAVKTVEDINPINNLKEMEAVTFNGVGGRSGRTMNAASRVYDESDKGVISEATVDSGDVAINTYLTSNPALNSVRGTSNRTPDSELSASNLMSTSANICVSADMDDPKRVNFINIQTSHTVACNGYTTMPVRTGYEQIISHRVGNGYCTVAQEDGVIESIEEGKGGVIRYKDGKTQGFSLGRRFGKAGGQTIPHEMVTQYKIGQKVKAGEVVAYNNGWFEPDYLNKGQVIYKAGTVATVALIETKQTHEDACTITEKFSQKLGTGLTKVKKVRVEFTDQIDNLINIGARVDFETPLMIIQDKETASIGAFSEETLQTLLDLGSKNTPTAKVVGTVEDIRVFYHGNKEDMSPSVKALANYGDKLLAHKAKAMGEAAHNGATDESYRVDGDPLLPGSMCIEFYITEHVAAGIADKVVFSSQMKSVISEVADYEIVTESGIEVDALFGAYSIFKRIVNSPFTIGTTTVLMQLGAQKALKMYKGLK